MSGRFVGACNAETATEAYAFALEIAEDFEQRVRVYPVGRGAVGQLMWDVELVDAA